MHVDTRTWQSFWRETRWLCSWPQLSLLLSNANIMEFASYTSSVYTPTHVHTHAYTHTHTCTCTGSWLCSPSHGLCLTRRRRRRLWDGSLSSWCRSNSPNLLESRYDTRPQFTTTTHAHWLVITRCTSNQWSRQRNMWPTPRTKWWLNANYSNDQIWKSSSMCMHTYILLGPWA